VTNSHIDTVNLPTIPFSATPAWLAAAKAAGYQCRCTGACGKSHRAHPDQRCPAKQGESGTRLHLHDGQLYCAHCFDPITKAARKQADAQTQQAVSARYAQDDLLSLLADQ
jgi:hypothetical protein